MDLTKQIEQILKAHPRARDDDKWLTLKIWATFYESRIDRTDPQNPKVSLRDIMDVLPREDSVKRIRAWFQNVKKLYPPTSIEIVKKRRQNEDRWREQISSEFQRL